MIIRCLLALAAIASGFAAEAGIIAIDVSPAGTVSRTCQDPLLAIPGLDAAPAGFAMPARMMAVARLAAGTKAADVPQGDDVMDGRPKALPERADLALPDRAAGSVGLWLCARGSAGQPGDELATLTLRYADGGERSVPLREGERLSGQLKDPFPTAAQRATSAMVGGVTVSTYVTWVDNPRPESALSGLSLAAAHPRYLVVLLGAALRTAEGRTADAGGAAVVEIRTPGRPRQVDPRLFAVAAPYFIHQGRKPEQYAAYDADLAELRPALISIFMPKAPEDGHAFTPSDLSPAMHEAGFRLEVLPGVRVMARQIREIPADEARWPQVADWYAACLAWLRDEQRWPIDQVEIFNEQVLNHPDADRARSYRFFNLVADRIHRAVPGVQVGGTAECYPDGGLIREFLAACGTQTDFVSWHLYPTGSRDTPLSALLERADRIPRIAEDLARTIAQAAPGRSIPQYVTEYNMNYSAWKPNDVRLKRGALPIWSGAVLAHALRIGHPQAALLWHFRDAAYGIYASDGSRPGARFFRQLNRFAREAVLLEAATAAPDLVAAAMRSPAGTLCYVVNTASTPRQVALRGAIPADAAVQTIGPDDTAFATMDAARGGDGLVCTIPGPGLLMVASPDPAVR